VTLIELLVVMVVIGIMAGALMGGLQKASQMAREAHTKATIAKIHHFMTLRVESYKTRRIQAMQSDGVTPIMLASLGSTSGGLATAATIRLNAIRDLMRMEMPERFNDINDPPFPYSWGKIPQPALSALYQQRYQAKQPLPTNEQAKCLYLTIMTGNSEAREQFNTSEIGDVDGDGWPEFLDGWGRPIAWLRWAPGISSSTGGISDIQSGNATTDHDPFDPRNVDANAPQLIPLIYSAAGNKSNGGDDYGLKPYPSYTTPPATFSSDSYHFNGNPSQDTTIGTLVGAIPIHNHHIESK
jgi:hypothetical protein